MPINPCYVLACRYNANEEPEDIVVTAYRDIITQLDRLTNMSVGGAVERSAGQEGGGGGGATEDTAEIVVTAPRPKPSKPPKPESPKDKPLCFAARQFARVSRLYGGGAIWAGVTARSIQSSPQGRVPSMALYAVAASWGINSQAYGAISDELKAEGEC